MENQSLCGVRRYFHRRAAVSAIFGTGAILLAQFVFSADKYWQGQAGGEWNVAANWVDAGGSPCTTGPQEGDVLHISEATVEHPVITTVTTDLFTGSVVLGPGVQHFNLSTFLAISGVVSGSGGICKYGASVLSLGGANTFTGDMQITNGSVFAYKNTSLGVGNKITCVPSGHLPIKLMSNNLVVSNDIVLIPDNKSGGGSDSYAGAIHLTSGSELAGNLVCTNGGPRMKGDSNATFTFSGTTTLKANASDWPNVFLPKATWSKYRFTGPFKNYGGVWSDTQYTLDLACTGNELCAIKLNKSGTKLMFSVDNALDDRCAVSFGGEAGVVDLNGHDQVVKSLSGGNASVTNVLTSSTGAAITMKSAANITMTAKVTGEASIVWDPTGNYTLTLSSFASDTRGGISVKKGTVALANGASLADISSLEVDSGATFSVPSGCAVNNRLLTLKISSDAVLDIPAGTYTVGRAWVDGQQIRVADYTHADYAFIPSGVTISVLSSAAARTCFWTGLGSDDSIRNAANWGEVKPAWDTSDALVFATTGVTSRVNVDGDVSVNNILLDMGNDLEFYGAGTLTVRGGLHAADSPSARNYRLSASVGAAAPQTWTVGPTGEYVKMIVQCPLSIPSGATLMTAGEGSVEFSAASRVSIVDTDGLVISNASTVVKGGAFSNETAAGSIKLIGYPINTKHVYFQNAYVTYPLRLSEDSRTSVYGGTSFFVSDSNTTNVFKGSVCLENNYVRHIVMPGSLCVFAGGMTQAANLERGPVPLSSGVDSSASSGAFLVTDEPVNVQMWWCDTGYATTTFAVPGNALGSHGIHLGNDSASTYTMGVRLACDGAFSDPPALYMSNRSFVDLDGHDASFKNLTQSGRTDARPVVKSATAATFSLAQSSEVKTALRFEGGASLYKSGAGTLILTNSVSVSTGGVTVAAGAVSFAAGSSWTNASFAVVNAGKLELTHGNVFSRATEMHVAEGGKVKIASGVVQKVGVLRLEQGGTLMRMPLGLWGTSSTPGVEHVNASFFEGSGGLLVTGDGKGTFLIIR